MPTGRGWSPSLANRCIPRECWFEDLELRKLLAEPLLLVWPAKNVKFVQQQPQMSRRRELLEQQEILTIYRDLRQKQLSGVARFVDRPRVGFSPPFFLVLRGANSTQNSLIPRLGTFPQHTHTLTLTPFPSSPLRCGALCLCTSAH